MNLFFGKAKEMDMRPNINETIILLRDSINMLTKRKHYVDKQMNDLYMEAQQHMKNKKKEAAMFSLKKRKMLEKTISHMEGNILNLEIQKMNLEQIHSNRTMFTSISQANDVLKKSTIDPDKVADVMEDLQEQMSLQEEVSSELSRPLIDLSIDDELASLEEDLKEEHALKELIQPIVLPNLPVHKIKLPSNTDVIERELLDLETELGITKKVLL
jgi:hypothetical protein